MADTPRARVPLVIQDADAALHDADRIIRDVSVRVRRASTVACPVCQHELSDVLDSRGVPNHGYLRRRRRCLACGARFSTVERVLPGTVKRSA